MFHRRAHCHFSWWYWGKWGESWNWKQSLENWGLSISEMHITYIVVWRLGDIRTVLFILHYKIPWHLSTLVDVPQITVFLTLILYFCRLLLLAVQSRTVCSTCDRNYCIWGATLIAAMINFDFYPNKLNNNRFSLATVIVTTKNYENYFAHWYSYLTRMKNYTITRIILLN